tara:strand:- start:1899 stop:2144 length:246 start_codon:yes stop_codon:yes gene_type:complete
MTGRYDYSDIINKNITISSEICTVFMALGAQKALLELELRQKIFSWAPPTTLLENLEGTHIANGGIEVAKRRSNVFRRMAQ